MMRKALYILFITTLTFVSCTDVEMSTDAGKTTEWTPQFRWDTISASRPDSMIIIANRAINTYRYVYSWNIEKSLGYLLAESTDLGYKKTSVVENDTIPYNPTDSTETDAQKQQGGEEAAKKSTEKIELRPGEYTVMAASMNPNIIYTCLNKIGFQQFMDSTVSPREISMYFKTFTRDSVQSKLGKKWSDFNPVVEYIQDHGPLYFGEQKQLTVPSSMPTAFTLKEITQRLTIRFQVRLQGKNVSINDVVGDISGIASNVRLSSLYMNTGTTRKMAFRPKAEMSGDSTINYSVTLNIPGILAGTDTTMLTGTGVLQLVLYANTLDEEGKAVKKTYYVAKNVNPEIMEGNYSKLGDDNVHLVIADHDIELNITTPIYINRQTILSLPDDVTTLNKWETEEDFDQGGDIEI